MEKVKLSATKAHQVYKLADGTRVPGGSTIAKLATANESQGALMHWAWKLGCEGVDYKKARDRAADAGTVAHFLIECYLKGVDADHSEFSPDVVDKAENAVIKFLDWWNKEGYTAVAVEWQGVSEEPPFGGTLDIVAEKDGKLSLIDLKTSSGIYIAHWIQVAGYGYLWNMNNGRTINDYIICRIGREDDMGDFEVQVRQDLSREWTVFFDALKLYGSLRECKKVNKAGGGD